ncbi:Sphingosine kinase 2 [Zootermopsis nevadensis]|uniref:sphingosine kinase n=1 Tax=Zootermopsis nevadensis TaxID=136037 RepID=A0A067R932_ZOONE|nr:Sphingosine kinase 2 [Zootermopsis nevadensis]
MDGGGVHGTPVLEETFYILSKKNTVYRVKLTEKGLSLQKESNGNTKIEVIRIDDIVGCRCMRSKRRSGGSCACHPNAIRRNNVRVVEENSSEQDEKDVSAYLYIYAYVLKKYRVKSGQKRERMTITLRFRSFDKYEDNMREAQKWRLAVKCLVKNKSIPRGILASEDSQVTAQSFFHLEERKLLVLLNPKSGPGKARELFQQRVVPVFAEAEIGFDLYVTKHANYARDFVRTKDIYQWRGVVVVGGDGIVFEVINGLFEREDWQTAVKELPVGVIPCGSGNGLAKTISYAVEEPYDQNPVLISTLSVIKCRCAPMDLVRVETKSQFLFSFLSVGWGLLSDIDIESERLRAIGGQRFTVWSVARLIGLRTYRGKLWYLPVAGCRVQSAQTYMSGLTRSVSHCAETGSKPRDIFPATSYTPVHPSHSCHDSINSRYRPLQEVGCDDPVTDSLSLETSLGPALEDLRDGDEFGRPRLDSYYSAASRRSTYFSTAGSDYRSVADNCSYMGVHGGGDIQPRRPNSNVRMYGPPSQLPALTQPVPDHWSSIEGDFILVHASYQSHLGSDCLFAPNSKLADGIIWLLVIRAGISRGQLLQFLLGLSSGSHLLIPQAEMIPVTAFRLEPETSGGHMTVDGEVVDYGPIQAELMPSLANIMSM